MSEKINLNVAQYCLGQKLLFNRLNIDIPLKKTTAILGASGVGKSTILKILTGVIVAKDILIEQTKQAYDLNSVAYMAQQDLLMPWLSVLSNVLLGAKLRGKITQEIRGKAEALLQKIGLTDHMHKSPYELSGGMRQRVALARTLMEDKPIILMDEPFSALDIATRHDLQNLAADLFREKTVVLVTHDPKEALRLAHHVIVLKGEPVKIIESFNLKSAPPRNLISAEFKKHEDILLRALLGVDA